MRVLTEEEIDKGQYMVTSKERARSLVVTKDYESSKNVVFKVTDPVSKNEHIVYYKRDKKPPFDWACDCRWYTVRTVQNGTYCAHILAVHLSLS